MSLVHQHVRKADDGVERRAQFVAHGGEEAAFGGIGALRFGMRVGSACCCSLRSVTSRNTATTSRDPVARSAAFRSNGRQRISIQTNSAVRPAVGVDAVAANAEFDRTRFAQCRGIAERGEIGRPVGDMDPVEQAVAGQLATAHAEQFFGGRRDEQHRTVAAMPGNDVGHVARQQPVAVLLGIEQPETGTRQRLGAERQAGRVKSRRNDAERRERGRRGRSRRRHRSMRAESSSKPAAESAKVEAGATTRRDAESAASSGTTTSQIAANEAMPPVEAATAVTMPVSASEDSTCALS